MQSVFYVWLETFKIANKKANDAVLTSDLSTTTDANTDVDERPIYKRAVRKPATYSPQTRAKIHKCATEKSVLKSPRPLTAEALAIENLPLIPLALSPSATLAETPGASFKATHSPCSKLALPTTDGQKLSKHTTVAMSRTVDDTLVMFGTQSEEVEGTAEMIEQHCSPRHIPDQTSTVSATAAIAHSLITRTSPHTSNLMTERHVVVATVTTTAETGISQRTKQHFTPRSTRHPIQDLRSKVADASSAGRCLINRTSPRRSNLTIDTPVAGTVRQGETVSGCKYLFVNSLPLHTECPNRLAIVNTADCISIVVISRFNSCQGFSASSDRCYCCQ